MVNYYIADLISRINNSVQLNKNLTYIPYTKDNYQILIQLNKLGLIQIHNIFSLDGGVSKFSPIPQCDLSNFLDYKKLKNIKKFHKYIIISFNKHSSFFPLSSNNMADISQSGKGEVAKAALRRDKTNDNSQQAAIKQYNKDLLSLIESQFKFKLSLISKPGRRIYIKYKNLKDFNKGFKLYLIRTSQGIITSQTAIKNKLGGELLLKVSYIT